MHPHETITRLEDAKTKLIAKQGVHLTKINEANGRLVARKKEHADFQVAHDAAVKDDNLTVTTATVIAKDYQDSIDVLQVEIDKLTALAEAEAKTEAAAAKADAAAKAKSDAADAAALKAEAKAEAKNPTGEWRA